MPKLPEPFDGNIIDIDRLFHGGHRIRAVRRAQELLREGYSSVPFLKLVAEMLDAPAKTGAGRPRAAYYRWLEVGEEFYELRETMNYEDAIATLIKSEGASEATIRRAIKVYDGAIEAHEQASRDYE
jgi:hypothetical protein